MNRVVINPARDMTDPVEVRGIFGANLRQLSGRYPSIAGLCRELGINRTQYNRYLSGESFPRPDVLQRICTFFDTDARILLEPVDELTPIRGSGSASGGSSVPPLESHAVSVKAARVRRQHTAKARISTSGWWWAPRRPCISPSSG